MDSFHFVHGETFASTWHYPAAGVAAYLTTLYALSFLSAPVAGKAAFKPVEVFHNIVLICLSATMMVGALVGAHERYTAEGLVNGLFCTQRSPDTIWDGKLGYFTYIFYLSKYYELLDTVLLSLRKKKIISLQVWHHATMLFVTWSWFAYPWLEGAWWCTFVNSAIHTAMYYYYLCTALGMTVWWKKYLTTAQIVQFCTGIAYVLTNLYLQFVAGAGCTGNAGTAFFSTSINISFIVMFSAFFNNTYKKQLRPDTPSHNLTAGVRPSSPDKNE